MPKIQLDVVVSQRKNRTDGFINYGQKADLSFYQIPVIIIEGGKPGKTLLVDGAMHGDETEGSEAIIKLAAEKGYMNGTAENIHRSASLKYGSFYCDQPCNNCGWLQPESGISRT